ncbi:MAG: isoprenyl transferase [Thermodesulfobacteriota bacterium]
MPPTEPDHRRLPRHVAIIMDGNGRWAEQRGLPRAIGHKAGVESVREIVEAAGELGITALTLYAFSTENWQRPPLEVQALMSLLRAYLESQLAPMLEKGVRLRCSGEIERLPKDVQALLGKTIDRTAGNRGLILNLALSYGGRSELVRAARLLAQQCVAGTLTPEAITEERLNEHLYTAGLPDPDLLIRTGGESRLSNFLLWQTSYSELYFTPILWPDFRKAQFHAALDDYQGRQRRFGKTGAQVVAG